MRLGVLPLGNVPFGVLDTEVLAPLRARDVDVVTPEAETPIATSADAVREAQRLSRADCDGVLLFIGAHGKPSFADHAALHLAGVPLLLGGILSGAFFAAAGGLAAIGVLFDRKYIVRDSDFDKLPNAIHDWLTANRREQRQRGVEAARKLYGQRLHIPADFPTPDPALWMNQFGLLVSRDAEGADFAAPNGDALDALTIHLLSLIVGSDARVLRTPICRAAHDGRPSDDARTTFARITTYAGRYQCIITRGQLGGDLPEGRASVRHYACPNDRLFAIATFAEFCAVFGEHVGALRAACHALDIEPIILNS